MVPIAARFRYAKKPSTIGAAAGDRGLPLFDVFLFDGDPALEVSFDACVVHDDLTDQRFHDAGVIGIHDTAVLHCVLEGLEPKPKECEKREFY